jgi:uncharacterized SAM-binding protein YcdF (DUF218 family)
MTGGPDGSLSPAGRRRARAVRVLVAAALLIVVGLLGIAAQVVTADSTAPSDAGADDPLLVLGGGGPERLEMALHLRGADQRPLVLFADARQRYEARGGACGTDGALCVMPRPMSTRGEAIAAVELVRDEGWDAITVVTSDFHVFRTRSIFDRCVSVPVTVVGAETSPSPGQWIYRTARETAAYVVSLLRDCE